MRSNRCLSHDWRGRVLQPRKLDVNNMNAGEMVFLLLGIPMMVAAAFVSVLILSGAVTW